MPSSTQPQGEAGQAVAEGPQHVTPWELRLGQMIGPSAFAVGAQVAAALTAAYLLFVWLFGFPLSEPGALLTESARVSINLALIAGYAFGALRWGTSGIERDLGRAGLPAAERPFQLPRPVVVRGRWAGALGLSFAVLLIVLLARVEGRPPMAAFRTVGDFTFAMGLMLLVFWLIGRAAVFTIHGSRFAAGASAEELEIDLLDVRPLDAFGQIGLRFALLWILGATIAAPLLLGPTLEVGRLLGAFAVAGALATVALLIPVMGVRGRIRSEKHAELERIASVIAGDASALAATRIAGRDTQPNLADLVAYRGLVESVREWPYDLPTLSRFGLYLLIPLASWVAAALVERLVDALLG